MPTLRIIKKYPNRRLYDTTLGTYITLDDVKKLVLDRVEFQVIDARTEKDLTQNTLLQIITEQEATSTPLFTTSILQDFIRSYHEKSQNAFSQYLEQAMAVFKQQKDFFAHQWQSYQKLFSDPAFFETVLKMQKSWPLNPLSSAQKKPAKHADKESTKKTPPK